MDCLIIDDPQFARTWESVCPPQFYTETLQTNDKVESKINKEIKTEKLSPTHEWVKSSGLNKIWYENEFNLNDIN